MNTTLTNRYELVPTKTKYAPNLERVYNKLNKGWRKTAAVIYRQAYPYESRPAIILDAHGKREKFRVCAIGCNSFGLEIRIKDQYGRTFWTAIEQLTKCQQAKVVAAIDWDTAD